MTDEPQAEAGFDPQLAKALSHPLRQQLLGAYLQRVASPSELAVEFGRPVNEVAYHTKRLAELGFIVLVRTERGPGLKHFYEGAANVDLDDESWRQLPAGLQRNLALMTVKQVLDEATAAASAGDMEAGAHVSRLPLELDDAARDELARLLMEVLERAQELSRESAARRTSASELRRSLLAVLHFPRA
jgi:hypothetical protein